MLLSIAILLIIWGAYLIGKKYKDSFFIVTWSLLENYGQYDYYNQ